MNANWNYPTTVRAGPGRISELPAICKEFDIAAPLLVTDPGLVGLPMVTDAVTACENAGLSIRVFSDIKPNPTSQNVDNGIEASRQGMHDRVIAFGGCTALDAGDTIAVVTNLYCSVCVPALGDASCLLGHQA